MAKIKKTIEKPVRKKQSMATAERKKAIMETFEKRCEFYREKKRKEDCQKQADDFLKRLKAIPKEAFDQVKLEYELFRTGVWQHNEETGKLEILQDSIHLEDRNLSCEYIDDKRPSVNRKMEIRNIYGREVPAYYDYMPEWEKSDAWEKWEEREKAKWESMNSIHYPSGYFGPFRSYGSIMAGQEIDPEKIMVTDEVE